MSNSSGRSQRRSSRLAQAYRVKTRAPAGTVTSSMSVAVCADSGEARIGDSSRRTSLNAL